MTASTGPKISSVATRWLVSTPVRMVGGWNQPLSGRATIGSDDGGTLGCADLAVLVDAAQLLGAVDGADVGVLVERIADPQAPHPGDEPVDELLGDRFSQQQT